MTCLTSALLVSIAMLAPQDPSSVEDLTEALSSSDEAVRIRAIEATAASPDPAIAKAVGKALGDSSTPVAVAAATALGTMPSTAALEVLHRAAGARNAGKDTERLAAVFHAIGRRGDPSSIAPLSKKAGSPPNYLVIRARIYALAQIRDRESIEALLGMMTLDAQLQVESAAFLEDFRVALLVLTGVDNGPSNSLWDEWWRKNKQGFALPNRRPHIAELHRLRWEGGTGSKYEAEAPVPKMPDTSGLTVESAVSALGKKDREGHEAAAAFLATTDDPQALTALHRLVAERKVQRDHPLFRSLMRAIARRADPSSVEYFAGKPFAVADFQAILARVYGLANVRSKESVDALLKLIQLASPAPGEAFIFLEDTATALQVLTGEDRGIGKESWIQWWRHQRDTFELPAERPWLPPLRRLRWEAFWGEDYPTTRSRPEYPHGGGMDLEAARRALSASDREQRFAGLAALSILPEAAALDALHRFAGREDVQEDPALFSRTLRAVGHRGDPSSVKVLADKPMSVRNYEVLHTRILGLANIRTSESIAALIAMMKLASPPKGEPFVFIDDLHTALCVLSGEDHGAWKIAWDQWWRHAQRGFEVAPARPPITPLMALRWEGFWGEPYAK